MVAYGKPKTIVSDNGTELTSNAILRWTDDHKVDATTAQQGITDDQTPIATG
jgi:hypothetical protein